jgi:hypothetical protein
VPPPYIIDASTWITAGRRHPPDIFVALWQRLDAGIKDGSLRSPEEVRHELERGEDNLAQELRKRGDVFVLLDAAQMTAVREVQAQTPLAVDEGERNRADAFVVALARTVNGTVVTGERPRRAATAPHKIPDACQHFGVPCLGWFEFLREVGWQV